MTFWLDEYAARFSAARKEMIGPGVDTLQARTFADIFYPVGHRTTGRANCHCRVDPAEGGPRPVACGLGSAFAPASSRIGDSAVREDGEDPSAATVETMRERGLSRRAIGMETRAVSVFARFPERIQSGLTGLSFKNVEVEDVCRVESPAGIGRVRQAAATTGPGVEAAAEAIRPGMAEDVVAAAAVSTMRRAGRIDGSAAGMPTRLPAPGLNGPGRSQVRQICQSGCRMASSLLISAEN